jgi:signal transduction histidine kinase
VTRLQLRFAAATAIPIALAGAAIFWVFRAQYIDQSEADVAAHVHFIEESVLRAELTPSNFAAVVRGPERRRLDRVFAKRVLIHGGLRVKLYRRDGLVVYSNDHGLIGERSDEPEEIESVLGGATLRDISWLNHEGGGTAKVKALEIYVPVQLRAGKPPAGVFELYESYAPVASEVRSAVVPFASIFLLTLVLLWAILFPLVARMTRALERQRAARGDAEQALGDTEEQLRQSQKMDAVGRLAGGIAHDFNNLLIVINGYADFLVDDPADERRSAFAREIRTAGDRAAALTQQLLAFSRQQVLQPDVMSLNVAVRDMTSMLKRLIGEGITIQLDLADELHMIEADRSKIDQVLLNLAVNARDAMAGIGTMTIATRNDGDEVVLEVSDTGEGMDDTTLARIFDPFFTTKDLGQGTGLGLSTVYGIVAQSDGTIEVRSAPGEGATFIIRVPVTCREPEIVAVHSEPKPTGEARLLLVDDDRSVCAVVAQMLHSAGYDVTTAASAAEARALSGDWDVLITDVRMAHTNGVALAGEIDARHTLFISGYDTEHLVAPGASFLQKPFDSAELARAVRKLLEGEQSPTSAAA